MQLTLIPLLPLLFAASAFGNPVTTSGPVTDSIADLDARQNCDIAKCLQTIGTQTAGIITPCGAAVGDLEKIGEAILQGKQPNQTDVTALTSDTVKCVFQSISAGFAIPGACLACVI